VTDEFSVSTRGEFSASVRAFSNKEYHTRITSRISPDPVESRSIPIIYSLEKRGVKENRSGRVGYAVVERALAGLGGVRRNDGCNNRVQS